MIKSRFNLIDEPWIPVAGKGLVGLKQIFSDTGITGLGGNPVEKIAVFKLLLAISQSAWTPKDEDEWEKLGVQGLSDKVQIYFKKHYDCFWLFGEKPFLQMPEIIKAEIKSFGDVQMMISTGNTTVVTQIQQEKILSDAEKAMLVLVLMGFGLGGKKTDNSVVLSLGYKSKCNEKGKPSTGKPGTSLGFLGLLHSFVWGESIIHSIWINIFSHQKLGDCSIYSKGLGIAPWEKRPQGEADEIADNLTKSYIGRLIPLSRFVLISDNGIHYSEGIFHPGYTEGVVDPSVTIDFSAKPKPKVLWADPEKRPWRQLPALLSFMGNDQKFETLQLKNALCKKSDFFSFTVWSGGVKVSSNAGEQYLTGTDDFVESEVQLSASIFSENANFFGNLTSSMQELDNLSKIVYASVIQYYSYQKMEATKIASKASNLFWQLCEREFQKLVTACEDGSGDQAKSMNKIFTGFVLQVYDRVCPNQTARQLEAWAKNRPFSYNREKEAV